MHSSTTRTLLLASTALTTLVLASTLSAAAQDATWLTTPASADFNTGSNWDTGTVPTGTAFFGASGTANLSISGNATLGGLTFNAGASTYAFTTTFQTLTLTEAGIVINGGSATFAMQGGRNSALVFTNSSSAGTATITGSGLQFNDSSTAGNATIANDSVVFNSNSTADNATITNQGQLRFFDASTAGNASIDSYGNTSFYGSTNAGSATITNNDGASLTFAQTATAGTARITNSSGASLTFRDASTAGNATITNSGVLSFTDISTAGNAAIVNNAFLSFSDNSTAGNATITNENFVAFHGIGSAGNATITNRGNLNFNEGSTAGNAAIVNNAGSVVDFRGTTGPQNDGKVSAGSIAGAGDYLLALNELTVGGNNRSTEVSGVISGLTGALVKTGTETLTLSGSNDYGGATTVNGGTLVVNGSIATSSGVIVNAGGTLGGAGQLPGVVVNAGGSLAPGNSIGTITVNGDLQFNAGSRYTVELSPTAADRTNVTGNAILTGATVAANALPGSFRGQTYTILNAAGGLGGTRFDGLTVTGSFSPARNPHLTYDPNNVYLVLDPGVLALGQGASRNQTSVAGGINRAVESGATLPAGFDTLLNMSAAAAGRALDQLSGESGTQAQTGAFQLGNSFLGLLSDIFGTRRDDGAAPLGYASERSGAPAAVRSAFAAIDKPAAPAPRWDVWGTAFGGGSNLSGDPARTGSHDAYTRAGAVAAGADYRFAANSLLGFSLAGGATNWSVGNGGGSSDVFMAGVYGKHKIGPSYIAAAASYANYWMSTTRTVTVAGIDQLKARFNAESFGGRIEAGYRMPARFLDVGWTPYGAIQGQSFRTPDYSEAAASGSNQFALRFAGRTATAFRAEVGLHTDKVIAIDKGSELSLFGKAAYAHDAVTDPAVAANFAVLGATGGFTAFGARSSQNLLLSSAGAEWRLASGVSFMVKADTEWGERSRSYSGVGRIRYSW